MKPSPAYYDWITPADDAAQNCYSTSELQRIIGTPNCLYWDPNGPDWITANGSGTEGFWLLKLQYAGYTLATRCEANKEITNDIRLSGKYQFIPAMGTIRTALGYNYNWDYLCHVPYNNDHMFFATRDHNGGSRNVDQNRCPGIRKNDKPLNEIMTVGEITMISACFFKADGNGKREIVVSNNELPSHQVHDHYATRAAFAYVPRL